jgi:SAM-dependent methyltransferase
MASSFASQIPMVVYLFGRLRPKTVLDVGKGFGKYGLLIHEFIGVDWSKRPDPKRTLSEQSGVTVDAVEIQPDYLFPHIGQFYRRVLIGDIGKLLGELDDYDLVLMTDVIEHLDKEVGFRVVRHFLDRGSTVMITTPKDFFHQGLFESEHEAHRSHWTPDDFKFAKWMDWQNCGPGRIYLLSNIPRPVNGFGNRPITRLRRVAGYIRDELGLGRFKG